MILSTPALEELAYAVLCSQQDFEEPQSISQEICKRHRMTIEEMKEVLDEHGFLY